MNNHKSRNQVSFYFNLIPGTLFAYLALISLLAPIFEEYRLYSASNYFYRSLSNICHQYPTRSLWILERPMGLCARCFSVYVSFSICIAFLPLIKRGRYIKVACLFFLPLILDGILQYHNVVESNNFQRIFGGVLFGTSASIVYKYATFNMLQNMKTMTAKPTVQSIHKYINSFIQLGVVCLTILYSLVFVFKAITLVVAFP